MFLLHPLCTWFNDNKNDTVKPFCGDSIIGKGLCRWGVYCGLPLRKSMWEKSGAASASASIHPRLGFVPRVYDRYLRLLVLGSSLPAKGLSGIS